MVLLLWGKKTVHKASQYAEQFDKQPLTPHFRSGAHFLTNINRTQWDFLSAKSCCSERYTYVGMTCFVSFRMELSNAKGNTQLVENIPSSSGWCTAHFLNKYQINCCSFRSMDERMNMAPKYPSREAYSIIVTNGYFASIFHNPTNCWAEPAITAT